jgi:hypothetical protein
MHLLDAAGDGAADDRDAHQLAIKLKADREFAAIIAGARRMAMMRLDKIIGLAKAQGDDARAHARTAEKAP